MRFSWMIGATAFVCAMLSPTATAGDGWRVVDTAGTVRFGGPGVMPVALTRDQELPADSWIETAAGRAILVRGLETVIVEPNSRLQLPSREVNGNTQVLQTLGSAIYKIGKQKKPHFQVDTPYLAAVVKGTAFKVSVEEDEASVTVTEGLVEVSTPDLSDVEFVRPGFTALVSRENNGEIVIDGAPSKGDEAVPDKTKSNSTTGTSTQAIVITQPIGDVDVDVKDVSGGLAVTDAASDLFDAPDGKLDRKSDVVDLGPPVEVKEEPVKEGHDIDPVIDRTDLDVLPTDEISVSDLGGPAPGAPDLGDTVVELDVVKGQGKGLAKGPIQN